jgi:enoyl-CoA hydratase/carnithine racemase
MLMLSKLDTIAKKVKNNWELIREGNVFYLVFNKPAFNDFNNNDIDKVCALLDQVESADTKEEPACLITFSTNERCFSTGFDLPFWNATLVNGATSTAKMQKELFPRLLKLSMPTMAIIRGNCFAGGVILALCHDVRIMVDEPKSFICLTEMNVGRMMPAAYTKIVMSSVPMQTARELIYSVQINAKEALEKEVVTNIINTGKGIDQAIDAFVSEYSPKAWNRQVVSEIKQRMHCETLLIC